MVFLCLDSISLSINVSLCFSSLISSINMENIVSFDYKYSYWGLTKALFSFFDKLYEKLNDELSLLRGLPNYVLCRLLFTYLSFFFKSLIFCFCYCYIFWMFDSYLHLSTYILLYIYSNPFLTYDVFAFLYIKVKHYYRSILALTWASKVLIRYSMEIRESFKQLIESS